MQLPTKNYNQTLDFLYDLSSAITFSPMDLIELIMKYFHFETVGFVSYTQPDAYSVSKIKFNEIYAFSKERDFVKNYNRKYFKEDFMDPKNLPSNLQGKDIIHSSELPKDLYANSEYYHFLVNNLGLKFFLSSYLYDNSVCIGRIGIMKTSEEGDFTDEEVTIMHTINRFVSKKFMSYLEYNNTIINHFLLDACCDKQPCGMAILDEHINITYSNASADQLSEEIIEFRENNSSVISGDIYVHGHQPLKSIVSDLFNHYIGSGHSKTLEFTTLTAKYSCSIVPFSSKPTSKKELITNYFVYIIKHCNIENESMASFFKKYNITNREIDILQLVDKGYSNNEISDHLVISNFTVKTHISNLYKKLNVSNRTSLLHKFRSEVSIK